MGNGQLNVKNLKMLEKLVVDLVRDPQLFRKFARNPRQVIGLESKQLYRLFPENYDFGEFVETIGRARRFFSRKKLDLALFEKFIHVSGQDKKLWEKRQTVSNWDHRAESSTLFQPSTETKPGVYTETDKGINEMIQHDFKQKGTSLQFGADFGPLIDPGLLAKLLRTRRR